MLIDRTLFVRGVAIGLAVVALWAGLELIPSRRLARSQDRLLAAAGNRNWKAVRALVADDFRDAWGQDREQAIERASEALQHFLVLEIAAEDTGLTVTGRDGDVSARLRFAGRGNAIGEEIIGAVNSLESPFRFAWRRKSWKPWDWKLVSISQNEIESLWTP